MPWVSEDVTLGAVHLYREEDRFRQADFDFAISVANIVVVALVLLVAAGGRAIDRLLTGIVFVDAIFFVLTAVALLVLRRRRPDAARPVRVPFYPFVPLLFVAGELCVIAGAALDPGVRGAALIGVAWIAAGTVCYLLFFRDPPAASPAGDTRS